MVNRFVVILNDYLKPLPPAEQMKRINEGIKTRNLKKTDIISITHEFGLAFIYFWDEPVTEK